MNYGLGDDYSVFLMSLQPNAPYRDRVGDDTPSASSSAVPLIGAVMPEQITDTIRAREFLVIDHYFV
jgi:hypothetical protein